MKQILTEMATNLRTKDEKTIYLENKVSDLKPRVDECDTYSPKDCLIREKLPTTNDINGDVPPISHQVRDFLKEYFNYETHPSNFKACQLLGLRKNQTYEPATFVKFIYSAKTIKRIFSLGHSVLTTDYQCSLMESFHLNSVKSKPRLKMLAQKHLPSIAMSRPLQKLLTDFLKVLCLNH